MVCQSSSSPTVIAPVSPSSAPMALAKPSLPMMPVPSSPTSSTVVPSFRTSSPTAMCCVSADATATASAIATAMITATSSSSSSSPVPSAPQSAAVCGSSNDVDSHKNANAKKSNARQTGNTLFPWKLYDMLAECEQNGLDAIVSWLPHGKAFRVHNSKAFVATIMPRHFKQTKYKSFQRQLNLWGFKRITKSSHPDKGAYWHKSFVKADRSLCQELTRQNNTKKSETPAATVTVHGIDYNNNNSNSNNGGTSCRTLSDDEDYVPDFGSVGAAEVSPTTNVLCNSGSTLSLSSSASSSTTTTTTTTTSSSLQRPSPLTTPILPEPHKTIDNSGIAPGTDPLQLAPCPSAPVNSVAMLSSSKDLSFSAEPSENLCFHDIVQSLISVPDLPLTPLDIPPTSAAASPSPVDYPSTATNPPPNNHGTDRATAGTSDPVSFEGCQFFLLNDDEVPTVAREFSSLILTDNQNRSQTQHSHHHHRQQQLPSFLGTTAA